jgi:hypothetical protein
MYAGAALVGTRQLPAVRIEVRKLAIPSMLCLFLHRNYTGYMLVVVPPETAIYSLGYVTNRVQDLRTLLAPFTGNPRLGFLVDALAIFHARLTAESHIQYRQTNQIANLNDITLETDWFNTEAEDEMSSLLLFGPPGRSVDFFNARDFDYDEGVMTVTARAELVAGVRDLHNDFPTVEPIGASLLPRLQPPGSATFGDELSSLRFAPLL